MRFKQMFVVLFFELWVVFGFAHETDGSLNCFTTCSNVFKKSTVSILGKSAESETEILAPFHSIIAKSRTNNVAAKKIDWICFAVTTFDNCADQCPLTNAKAVKMSTMHQWNVICNAKKEAPKAFLEFIHCERKHIDKTMRQCQKVTVKKNMALGDFCKNLQSYSQCYASVPFECSNQASNIWLRVNNAIEKSYKVILQLSSQHLRLPPECHYAMATTVQSGIETTSIAPKMALISTTLKVTTTNTPKPTTLRPWRSTLSTLVPPVGEDSSGMDDYSYFQQTDDYKFFGEQKALAEALAETTTSTMASNLDYWIDLDGDGEANKNTATGHSQRHVDIDYEEIEDDELSNEENGNVNEETSSTAAWPSTDSEQITVPPDLLINTATKLNCFVFIAGIFAQLLIIF